MLWFNADIYLQQDGKQKKQYNKQSKKTTSKYECAVSAEPISEKVASFSTNKFGVFLSMKMQDKASAEYTGLKGVELVAAMKWTAKTPSPTPTKTTTAPQNTAAPAEPTGPAAEEVLPF
jgi:hypothetical protein